MKAFRAKTFTLPKSCTPSRPLFVPALHNKHHPRSVYARVSLIEAPQVLLPGVEEQLKSYGSATLDGQFCGPPELLVYLPGTDGTGLAISPQLPYLQAAGYDVLCLYFPPESRPTWDSLVGDVVPLLESALREHRARHPGAREGITLVGESFGGALALRIALEAPHLLERCVVMNPATSFLSSLGGLSNLIASTSLLQFFPEQLYIVAQAVLFPFLVDREKLSARGKAIVRSLMDMSLMAADPSSPATSVEAVLNANVPPPKVRFVHEKDRDGPSATPLVERKSTFVASGSANHRFQMLRTADLPDRLLRRISVPTLLVASGRDRLLPSTEETARLHALIPNSRRIILPESSHTPLMEEGFDLIELLTARSGFIAHLPCQLPLSREQLDASLEGPQGVRSSPLLVSLDPSRDPTSLLAAVDRLERPGSPSGSVPPVVVLQKGEGGEGEEEGGAVKLRDTARGDSLRGLEREAAIASLMQVAALAPREQQSGAHGPKAAPSAMAAGSDRASPSFNGVAGGSSPSPSPRPTFTNNPANDLVWERAGSLIGPWKALTQPVLLGVENLPVPSPLSPNPSGLDRPHLFIGNHTLLGLYDTPLLMHELYLRGLKLRGLAHAGHFSGPAKDLFEEFGAVKATPRAAFKLLSDKEPVLLFPGGAKEVCKRKGQSYKLLWPKDIDFVRLAARTNAVIVPFSMVGGDDAFEIYMDPDEILASPIGGLVRAAYGRFAPDLDISETVYPIFKLPSPLGPLPLPSPLPLPQNIERIYIKFQPPVDAAALLDGRMRDTDASTEVYRAVRKAVEDGIQDCQDYRERDPGRNFFVRMAASGSSLLPDVALLERRGGI